ncbi:Protein SCAR2 [Carex littledalei]|uniref:Protein SCAR n=1 Tax=Carex littledalei TaxID=544730 RepID=A0A833QSQ3_9POAL|nr:Protein SCAR2 [Carex littledalei]
MTMYGYEIRNEYGLGAAELYKTAYQDDPEAILEGVAVAGLVGFLRQLGDLAEFAAEIFHGLHEEITNTASRSQNIMHRVQQLEADLPMVEKDLFHDRYTDYALMEGIRWHPNLETDSNIVTKEEMPPYVMEYYKQSRGPPQLFRLDKFDKAGAGACLKRHTDPSFYKVDLSIYGITRYRRETRTLKATRKLNPISTDITRSLKMSQNGSRPEMGKTDEDLDEVPPRRAKLKPKQFNSSLLSHMQNLLEIDSPAHGSFSKSISYTSTELETPNGSFTSVEKISTTTFHKRLKSLGSLINHNRNRQDTSSSDEKDDPPSSELLSNSSTPQQYQTGSPPDQDTESGENSDEYISDATASEVEFLDALTATVDSEMETDAEVNHKNNPSFVSEESKKFSSERKEERNNGDITEEVPKKTVVGNPDASAPISDGDFGKRRHETEPHYVTVSFKKVASKKVSYEENEFNPVTTNENGVKPTPKLQKDSFSLSLRHMAKQLLELKHDLTEDEEEDEVYSQDLEENEDELLFDRAGVRQSGTVEKGEYLIENVQSNNLIAEDMETIETEINRIVACFGEDQADLTSHENDLHGLQNIDSIETEQSYTSKEINRNNHNNLIAEDMETIETEINRIVACFGEDQADLTSHENDLHGLQNIDSIETEQSYTSKEFGEHEVHISSDVTEDGEKQDEISIDGTVTRYKTKDRVSDNEISEAENVHSIKIEKLDSGEELHADETSVDLHNMENPKETYETVMDGLVAHNLMRELHKNEMAETQNLTLVEKEQELVDSGAYLGSHGMQHGEKTYEIPGHGTVTKRSIKEEVIFNDMSDNQNLSSEEGEEFCESEMHVDSDSLRKVKKKTEKLINEEVSGSDGSEPESLNSNEKELYESEMYAGLDGKTVETYELPVNGTETRNLIQADDFDSGIAEFQIENSIKNREEFLQNEMDVSSDDMQHGKEPDEILTASTGDENLVLADPMPENLLQEQNTYHEDATEIQESEYLSDNQTEPWDSEVEVGLSVEALVDHYELLEEETRATEITTVSPRPLIKDNILLEALQSNNETSENKEEEEEAAAAAAEAESVNPISVDPVKVLGTEIEDGAVTPVACNSEVISVPVDPVTDLDNEIVDWEITPVACNSEVISVPVDPVTDLDNEIVDWEITPVACNSEVITVPVDPVTYLETEIQDEVVTAVECNSEVIPDRVMIFPPIQSIAPTSNATPEQGDIVPALPPLPPMQWRMGKPPMGPLPSLGPMAPPPRSSQFCPLPNFSNLGRPPRPKSSRVAARERKLHEVENEQIKENFEMISNTKELHNRVISPSLEKDTSLKRFASIEKNPICNETILRCEEALVKELSLKEEPLSTGDEMEEEPRKKQPSVPIPPKYPLFQVTSHDNSMLKKAPTLIQPASRLITPSMLEEIKNKSCSLKPVMVRKPNFMGPYSRTNLKVAAMLEKANAIRQAVGSDDSDNDSWSE